MTNFLEYLIESSDCLYIYNRNFSIYGLPEKERYTVIVKDDWVCPEDWIGFDKEVYEVFYLKEWFDFVLNGDLIGWECACLNKKYVIKEHVKLMMTTNPIQLRKTIDKQLFQSSLLSDINLLKEWELIKNIKFAVQIIDNHKIVNFKEAKDDYNVLQQSKSSTEFFTYKEQFYNILKNITDGMLKQELLKKVKNARKL